MESNCRHCRSHEWIYQNIVQGHWVTRSLAALVDMGAHAHVVVAHRRHTVCVFDFKALLLPVCTYLALSFLSV